MISMTSLPSEKIYTINPSKYRIESIDLLKGLVMVIMALDHVRDFFHHDAYLFNPTDPTHSSLPLFLTRFVTHFCAPTFSLLAGLSAFMAGRRKTPGELSVFLLTRGVWLILMEVTIVTFGWQFDPYFRMNGFAVIAALGFSMIALAGLIHLPRTGILIFSCVLIFGHNLLDTVHIPGNFLWSFFHDAAIFKTSSGFKFYMDYPVIPWLGIMSLGYWFGPFYDKSFDAQKRKSILNIIGISAILLFIIFRATNVYGDPVAFTTFETGSKTIMSFFQVTKYPPSLQYALITMGCGLLFLANTENLRGTAVKFFSTFGRVPFFYFILHVYLIHLLAAFFAKAAGFGWLLLVLPDWIIEVPEIKQYGFDLWVTYIVWIGVILSLYPLCKRFDVYKQKHKAQWWLSYL
ncbi:MAG: heparan-alpha-glucosaminide N-acetyltransferase domain-containing protein [Chryseolinea sp.]